MPIFGRSATLAGMYLNLAPGAVSIGRLPIEQLVDLARRHGFGGVDLPRDQINSVDDADRARGLIEQAGLRWGLFGMPLDIVGKQEDYDAGLAELRQWAPLAQRCGCRRTYDHIWSGHDTLDYAENFHLHVGRIGGVVSILKDHGITFGIEFLGPLHLRSTKRHAFIHRLDQALELIAAIGPGAGLVLDTFHWYCSGGTLEDLEKHLPGVPIVNVHTNDAQPGRGRDEQLDGERDLPLANGIIDAAGVIAILHKLGYDGPVIAEPFNPQKKRLADAGAEAAAAEVGACLRRLLDRAGV